MWDKIGRNDPCPCGSGQKFKRCHLGREAELRPLASAHRRASRLVLDEEGREGMRAAGRFNARLMDAVRDLVRPGITTAAIDDFVREYTLDHGHVPACLGYQGYPKSCCTSINEVVCHGIPSDRVLVEGDIVNVDLTTIVDGWHGDQSETFLVGEVSDEARALVQCAFDGLHRAIAALGPYSRVAEIGRAIAPFARAQGFSVVEAFQGHGIGRKFHQPPSVPHYPEPSSGQFVLEPGIAFTIEPMINAGTPHCVVDRDDGWTARTADGRLSAQFEHTILMTEDGPEVLTETERGPRPGHRF